MSHFYGTLQGNRGQATRCGTANTGIVTQAAGWKGCIEVRVWREAGTDTDMFRVTLRDWQGSGGMPVTLASGKLDSKAGYAALEFIGRGE